jgi:hypothetical protein
MHKRAFPVGVVQRSLAGGFVLEKKTNQFNSDAWLLSGGRINRVVTLRG